MRCGQKAKVSGLGADYWTGVSGGLSLRRRPNNTAVYRCGKIGGSGRGWSGLSPKCGRKKNRRSNAEYSADIQTCRYSSVLFLTPLCTNLNRSRQESGLPDPPPDPGEWIPAGNGRRTTSRLLDPSLLFFFLPSTFSGCGGPNLLDFNSSRPLAFLGEHRDIILFPAGEETRTESNYSHKTLWP